MRHHRTKGQGLSAAARDGCEGGDEPASSAAGPTDPFPHGKLTVADATTPVRAAMACILLGLTDGVNLSRTGRLTLGGPLQGYNQHFRPDEA